MKRNDQGSFGIPEPLRQAMEQSKEKREEKNKGEQPLQPPQPEQPEQPKEEVSEVDQTLKALNIEFTQEDFQKLLFKGSIEKDVEIVKGHMTAKFRTLTGNDWDEIDELLARETKDISMTIQGMDIRKSVFVLAYGITELQKKPLSKQIKNDGGEIDTKQMAIARRKVIQQLSPSVTNLMIEKHGALTRIVNLITRDPGTHLKNS